MNTYAKKPADFQVSKAILDQFILDRIQSPTHSALMRQKLQRWHAWFVPRLMLFMTMCERYCSVISKKNPRNSENLYPLLDKNNRRRRGKPQTGKQWERFKFWTQNHIKQNQAYQLLVFYKLILHKSAFDRSRQKYVRAEQCSKCFKTYNRNS